jgi:hypothetical protein
MPGLSPLCRVDDGAPAGCMAEIDRSAVPMSSARIRARRDRGYQDIVGTMRALVRDLHGGEDGDPAKAARALDLALQADSPPLRLQVGADSIVAVRAHAEQLLRDLAAWEQVGSDVRIDPNAPDEKWHSRLDLAQA